LRAEHSLMSCMSGFFRKGLHGSRAFGAVISIPE
jgi:hypothetical protein